MEQRHEILLVEDDQSHIRLIKRAFERNNGKFSVVFAHSLGEAKAYLTDHEPELIIADMRLPDGRGDELLEKEKPVVLMSSGGDEDLALKMKKAGAIDYMVKSAEAFSDIAFRAEKAIQEWEANAEKYIIQNDRDKLTDRLERKSKELQNILYVISHDLGSPLLSIRAFSHELKRICGQIEKCVEDAGDESVRTKVENLVHKDVKECLEYIRLSTDEIGRMLEELKQLSRVGRAHLDIKPLDMARIVREQVEDMKVDTEGVKIEVGELPDCMGDDGQMRRVFNSLFGNAAKRIEAGRTGVIRVGGQKKGDMAIYTVEDNGVGMNPEEKERLFEIFYRSNGDRNGGGEQEPVGLAIVQEILERQAGRIWIESELGRGSAFHIELPAA